jgi:hypothetical protein
MARAYRRFAAAAPRLYPLVLASGPAPSPGTVAAVRPLMAAVEALVGPAEALAAARAFTAFVHGFASMEIAGNFQLGGSVDAAFDYGLAALLRGLAPGPDVSP